MNPHTLLRSLLLIPLVVPLLVVGLVEALQYAGVGIQGVIRLNTLVFITSLVVGGVPYLMTAALLWFRIGRCGSRQSAIKLMFIAPLIFAPLQAIAMLLWSLLQIPVGVSVSEQVGEGVLIGLVMSIYGLIFGYFYAACTAIIFLGAARLGLVAGFASTEPPRHGAHAV